MGHPSRNSAVTVATRLNAATTEDTIKSTVLLNGGNADRTQIAGIKSWKYGSAHGFGGGLGPLRSTENRYMPLRTMLLVNDDALY